MDEHIECRLAPETANETIAWRDIRRRTLREMGYIKCGHPYHRIVPLSPSRATGLQYVQVTCASCSAELSDGSIPRDPAGTWIGGTIDAGIDWETIDGLWPKQAEERKRKA